MKKYVQLLSLILALVMTLAIGTYAAEEAGVIEPTTAVQEENTTLPDATQPEEETTQPEEETTTKPQEETTTLPQEETTTQPEITEPTTPDEPTDPTEPTEPSEPEIILPEAPAEIMLGNGGFGFKCIYWDSIEGVEGYDV